MVSRFPTWLAVTGAIKYLDATVMGKQKKCFFLFLFCSKPLLSKCIYLLLTLNTRGFWEISPDS